MQNELGCTFNFDFREVYWNSRLHTEHERLAAQFSAHSGVIVDVMAGVGPFAVPAAKRGLAVLANDLNPDCYKWHQVNARANKVRPSRLQLSTCFEHFTRSLAIFGYIVKTAMSSFLRHLNTSSANPSPLSRAQ